MILRFSEEFLPYTNGQPELHVEAATVGESLRKAFDVYPQLYVHLMDGKAEIAQRSMFRLNGEFIYEHTDCAIEVSEGDVLSLAMEVPQGAKGALKYVAGALMVVVGVIMLMLPGAQVAGSWMIAAGWGMIIGGAISLIATGLMDAFGPSLKLPDAGGSLDNSSNYTFSGIRNTTATGTPLPIVYGEFRVGGQFLNIYTESTPSQTTSADDPVAQRSEDWLYAQIGLCEGEIDAVSEILVNKLPTNFYNAIEFVDETGTVLDDHLRLGTATQSPMPHFNKTSNTTTIGRKVICPSSTPISAAGGFQYEDTPLYGYRDANRLKIGSNTSPIVYGTYTVEYVSDGESSAYVYTPCTRDTPGVLILPWEERNVFDDGPVGAPRQINVGGLTYERRYADVSSVTFDAEEYTRTITSKEVNAFAITLTLPGLYKTGSSGYETATVSVTILYRLYQSGDPWSVVARVGSLTQEISGKQRAEITRTYSAGLRRTSASQGTLPYGIYEIAIIRNTPDHSGWFDIVDDIYVKQITEYTNGSLAYPHTAMLGAVIRATDQLNGNLPSISSKVRGRKVALPVMVNGVWNGNLSWDEETQTGVKYWSDNPCWCLYDLLTNRRFGCADYYPIAPDKLGIVRANFYMMAQYCDELINYTGSDGEPHTRKRFTLNMVIDQSRSASEWIAAIAATMRATCFYTEGIFWIDIDRPKYMTQIFNMSNIKDFTQSGTSFKNIPNCYEVQYPNPQTNFEIDSFRVESKTFQDKPQLEERKKALTFMGVTDFEQAKALTKYALVTGEYLTKIISFRTGTQGLRCTIADVIGIQHDIPQTGWGGKITEVEGESPTFTLALSTPFDYLDGMGAIQLTLEKGGAVPVTLDASAAVGTGVTSVTVDGRYLAPDTGEFLIFTPAVGDTYILALTTNKVAPFKVLSIKRDADEMCEISAIQYDAQVYTLSDDTSDLGDIKPHDYSNAENPLRSSVRGVDASMKLYRDSAGVIKIGIEVFYQVPTSSFWSGAVVHWGIAGSFNYQSTPIDTTGSVFIPDITTAGRYQVIVTSVYKTGQQSINDALEDDMYRPFVFVNVTPYVPNDSFLAGVSGLEVVGSLDGTYYGKECRLQWRAPVILDQYMNQTAGATATGNSTSSWLAYYQVEIKNTDGSLRRPAARTTSTSYSYSHEMNHEDGRPAREYDVSVTIFDRLGRNSAPATLRVSNPPPAAIPRDSITIKSSVKMFAISFTPSAEQDVEGYAIHGVHESDLVNGDFTPTGTNLLNRGKEASYVHPVDQGGNWYVKVAAYDSFTDTDAIDFSGLVYSGLLSVSVPTLDMLDEVPPEIPVGLHLTTAVDITGQADTSSITATWDANLEDDLAGYILQIRQGESADYTEATIKVPTLSYVFTGLIPGTAYSCRLASYDRWSNVSTFTAWTGITSAASTAVPPAPSLVDLSAGIGTLSIIVSCTKPNTWQEYEIEASTTAAFTPAAYSARSVSDINSFNVDPGTYYVRVRSVTRAGILSTWTASTPAHVTVDPTAAQLLTELTGQITANQLFTDLAARIDLVDAPTTGLVQQMVTVNNNMTSLQTQLNSLTVGPFDAAKDYIVGDLVSYEVQTYKCIQATTAPSPLPTDMAYWETTDATSLAALVAQETELRIAENEAISNAIMLTSTTLNGQTTAIAQQATSINGLEGQYTVKIDTGNKVIGFGLASGDPHTASSEFIVNADKFMVSVPTVDGGTPKIPFVAGIVAGQPAVVMPKAFIADASIDTARIDTLDIGSGKVTGILSVNRLGASSVNADKLLVGVTHSEVNDNPEFSKGTAGYTVYDLGSTGLVTLSAVAEPGANSTGQVLQIVKADGTGTSPGLGGFYLGFGESTTYALRTYRRGTTIKFVVRAKIPTGFTLSYYTNAYGTGGTTTYPSSTYTGTGSYKEYVFEVTAGTTGTFNTIGHFALNDTGGGNAVTWYVSHCNAFLSGTKGRLIADDILTGKLSASTVISVGDDKVKIDGTNKRITVSDGTYNRVTLGNLGTSYGLDIKNSTGVSIFTSDGNIDGTKIRNLAVTGNVAVGGQVTIGGAVLTFVAPTFSGLADKPTSLLALNATDGNKLAGIEPYATAGKSLASPLSNWVIGAHTLVTLADGDGKVGKTALRIGTAAGYPRSPGLIPLDRTKNYKFRFWARPSGDPTATNGLLYSCLVQYINETTTIENGGHVGYAPAAGVSRQLHYNTYGTYSWGEYTAIRYGSSFDTRTKFFRPDFLNNYAGTQGYWDVQDVTVEEVTDVQAALDTLSVIANDRVLSKGEKPAVAKEWDIITAEYPSIRDAANSVGVSPTNYITKTNVLSNYLTGILVWDYSVDTAIDPAVFVANFSAYYSEKALLQKAIAEKTATVSTWAGTTGTGKPADYATTDIRLGTNGNCTIVGNTAHKSGGAESAWDADCYSLDSYQGGCFCQFRIENAGYVMAGLTTDTPSGDGGTYSYIDYAWYLNTTTLYIYLNGSSLSGYSSTFTPGSILAITYDGSTVRFYLNGAVVKSLSVGMINKPMFFDSSFYRYGLTVSGIKFGPLSSTAAALSLGTLEVAAALNVRNYMEVGQGLAGQVLAGISATGSAGTDIRFWAGTTYANRASANFRVDQNGKLTCTGAAINGAITSGGTITGASFKTKTATNVQRIEIDTATDTFKFYEANIADWSVRVTASNSIDGCISIGGETGLGVLGIGLVSRSQFLAAWFYGNGTEANGLWSKGTGRGSGVYGYNPSTTGTGIGVQGASSSAAGRDFYASGAGSNGPFTGAHDGLVVKGADLAAGDIVNNVGASVHKYNVSNTIFEVALTDRSYSKQVLGVFCGKAEMSYGFIPTGLKDPERTTVGPDGSIWPLPVQNYGELMQIYDIAVINSIGEGQINVCKDGGNIEAGDYICSSNRPGKGMKQDDDLLHNYTVAKAREACVWADYEDDIRMIACTYHCG